MSHYLIRYTSNGYERELVLPAFDIEDAGQRARIFLGGAIQCEVTPYEEDLCSDDAELILCPAS